MKLEIKLSKADFYLTADRIGFTDVFTLTLRSFILNEVDFAHLHIFRWELYSSIYNRNNYKKYIINFLI